MIAPTIKSGFALLDVTTGRKALAKYVRSEGGMEVVIHAVIREPFGRDDGTSVEFNCDVLKIEAAQ